MKLRDVYLCVDCEEVTDQSRECPSCLSRSLLCLSRILNRETSKREIWFSEWRPIINAIGEISVREAMNAIERDL